MKLALLGYGKMGRRIEQLAEENGHEVVAVFSPSLGLASQGQQKLASADIAIDFSHASAVSSHLDLCIALGKPLIIGTTGWESEFTNVQKKVQQSSSIGCLYAPNFSLGFCLYQKIVAYAASLFQPFPSYDISGIESHHKQKQDYPSGSAKALIKDILIHMQRLENVPFASIRCGHIPGNHTILLDGPTDTITLTHTARSRDGFVQGVFTAVDWLMPRKGMFSLDDMLDTLFSGEKS